MATKSLGAARDWSLVTRSGSRILISLWAGWDIGADERPGAGVTNYRSIGTAANYTTGTINATNGSAVVTGTGTSWQTANRGRGDRIDINGTDYMVLSVDSETQLTLTTTVSGNFTGTYTLWRQFTTLQGWENCISGAGGCTYFPVVGGDLVAVDSSFNLSEFL